MAINNRELKNILATGETVRVEFKRCDGGITTDTYETVCSFSNRYGGDIFLGVDDNKKVFGVPENADQEIIRNFVTMVNNPEVIFPVLNLAPEILIYEGKKIIHVRVPASSDVHKYKKEIYDRLNDSDIRIRGTEQIRALYIRKQKNSTERMVYLDVSENDLRINMLSKIRKRVEIYDKEHPWIGLNDKELLKSAKLYSKDAETGKWGYNLAAVMLFGKDDLIFDIVPAYRTDAILRKVNFDRYDDRKIIMTNLIDSLTLLMEFAKKHLWDKFYLEGDKRVSLRDIIAREMLVNTLMHREFISSHMARFVIEKDKMYTVNANRVPTGELITPEKYEPNQKNPIIAAFFRNMYMADELGSGVRRLYHYAEKYSGKLPEIIDEDVFKAIVPLDDEYSYDMEILKAADKVKAKRTQSVSAENVDNLCNGNELRVKILELIRQNSKISASSIAKKVGIATRNVQSHIQALKNAGYIERIGKTSNGYWIVKQP